MLPLSLCSCLSCPSLLIRLPLLRSLLRRTFFLPYAYYVAVVCLFLLLLFVFLLLVFLFLFVCLFCILSWRWCPLQATFISVSLRLFSLLFFLRPCSRLGLVWFCLSCDHGWIRSGSVDVEYTTIATTTTTSVKVLQCVLEIEVNASVEVH